MGTIIVLTLTALILSIILAVTNALINKEDKKEEDILSLLPGVNCGVCGYGSCKGMASEILKNKDSYVKCRVLRGEKKEALEAFIKKNIH